MQVMAGRTNRALLRVHSIPMGRPKPPHPSQTIRGQVSPRKTKGAAVKPEVEFQKQKTDELCQFLLGKASLSDNVFSNCQNSLKRLELLQAELLKEVPWAKDLTSEQNHFIGLVGLLVKEFQRQKAEIQKLVGNASDKDRLIEYKSKQIKELQNHYEIQILAIEEEKQKLLTDLRNLKLENQDLQDNNKKCLESIENYETQLQTLKQNQEKSVSTMNTYEIKPCDRKLHPSNRSKSSSSLSESMFSSRSLISRETTRKSMKSDLDSCDSPFSFANSENSTVPSVCTQRESSNMSDLSFANSTHSEEQQKPCLLCSQPINTTKVFLCSQCIEKSKIN